MKPEVPLFIDVSKLVEDAGRKEVFLEQMMSSESTLKIDVHKLVQSAKEKDILKQHVDINAL